MLAGSPLLPHLRRAPRIAAAVLVFAVAVTACLPIPPPTDGAFAPNPPVYGNDFPDPFVAGGYVALSTNVGWSRVPSATASSLNAWTPGPDVLTRAPTWELPILGRFWAPAVHQFGATWVLYFTAPMDTGGGNNGPQCIGVATATNVAGPYEPLDDGSGDDAPPIVCEAGGSIDPSVVVDEFGDPWLLWKNDGNCCAGLTADIWSQPLEPDGLGLKTGSSPTQLIGVTQAWEDGSGASADYSKRVVEGPTMTYQNGEYWLLYSGSWWESSNYAVGYARCDTPAGPCRKPRNGPILKSGPNGVGPGGTEVFSDTAGQLWVAYHSWGPTKWTYASGGVRTLRMSRLSFGAEPIFGGGP